ncbi:MAG: sulfatase-like hydrolase/transferase [Terriglobales bacterium]|jgi:arylsulfatase A-like enzyme/cytochrome c-type biogenesis protein CcmH/NrfG
MSLVRRLLCFVGLTAGALAGAAVPPNIVLITVDTTRADRMGFLGSKRGLTPNLDALARYSVVFTHAYAQAPFTAPSHATILTGTYPQFHQVEDFPVPLSPDLPYAPAILKAQGYHTAAFIGSIVLDPSQGLGIGFDRGFDTYDAGFHLPAPGEDRYSSTERRGEVVVEHALAWLGEHTRGPFFIWVHLYDAHDPYQPPEPFKSRYKSAPYDGGVAYADSAVGRLLDQLRARGLYENSVIAVMSDHGEGLGDHKEEFHGFFLYDATIHVPLVLKLPGERFAGKRIENLVGLVDVLPTVLQSAGIEVPREAQGESLLGLMMPMPIRTTPPAANSGFVPASSSDRPQYAETEYGLRGYGWSTLRSLRTGKYLFIEAPRRELYDLAADPDAEHNLAAASKAVADTLQAQLDAFRQKTGKSGEAPRLPSDPQTQEKLAALGYMSASALAPAPAAIGTGVDPKDKIEVGNMMAHASTLMEDKRFDEAVLVLQQVIAKDPDMIVAYSKLGTAEAALGNFAEAIKAKRKAVELAPDSPDLHFELGNVLVRAQDFEAAIPELEGVAAEMQQQWRARMLLALAYSRTNRLPQAINECEKVLAVLPEQYGTNLLLGRVLLRSGKAETALPRLSKAASLRPQAPEPHLSLAAAYAMLGRDDDAEREQAMGERLAENR